MHVLRLLVTALLAAFALMAGLFLAAVVFFTGLAAMLTQRFRKNPLPSRPGTPLRHRSPEGPQGDVIDVVATQVPPDRGDGPR